ncbi:uncharacterized protein N7496_011261 [Penicillium cataractarum]|uniref:Rhodopsin domain-containing protein n=1 Tax=Penicillium cataractarum TaxID=2100454 RepID=A0A9W9REM8_9EURO|nr:uncharacterized protein N7496_011261 [Penicillium cataractarum]KAJ5358848.1 hypothetical protein N7496_011261 [Penicillium cataractarum]
MNLSTTPGMEPPAGQTSNLNAPWNSLQIGTVIAFGVTYFLATAFLALRYFQAVKLTKKIEVDLVVVTISYGVAAFYFASIVKLMNYGWGKHMWDVSLADLVEFNKTLLPNTLSYLVTPAITKMAILSVLYRINPSTTYRYLVIAVTVAIFAYTLTLCTITGGPCNPLKSGTTKCLMNVALAQAVLNIASDLAVIALPIPTIHNLQFSMKQKLTVGSLLALGSGVVICSIARLPYVLLLDKTSDTTYTEAILGVWSLVEVNLGIICACAMRFKRLIATYLPRLSLFSSQSRSAAKVGYDSRGNNYQSGDTNGRRSYQLHSIQNGSADPFSVGKGISIHQTFKVDVKGDKDIGDGGSTDRILT